MSKIIPTLLLVIVGLNDILSVEAQQLCSNAVTENKLKKCPSIRNVTERFQTVRDLAWFLTPRTYFLPNANEFTFRRMHEALSGECAEDDKALMSMRPMAKLELDSVRLSMKDGAHYLSFKCRPTSSEIQGLWSEIIKEVREENVRDWPSMEKLLHKIGTKNPHLYFLISEFGHIRCDPHPFCESDIFGNTFCSKGSKKDSFKNWEGALTWTDHISDTEGTGTAFMLSSCVDEKPSWAVFSIVPQQSTANIDEFWAIAKEQSFRSEWYAWQNFVNVPTVPQSFFQGGP